MNWPSDWTQVTDDYPLDQGRAAFDAWLDAHGISEAEREDVVRVEIVKTSGGDVLRLLVRSDFLQSRGLAP